jgi:cyclophilin family peptidyl-prolyl cis-trans isomerase
MSKNILFIILLIIISLADCKSQDLLPDPGNTTFTKSAPAIFKVLLETTKGDIILEVNRGWSPNGADRFYNLVRNGYYDNTAFFRVRAGTWAQFGIAADPKVAQTWRNKTIPDDPSKEPNTRGMVSYAFKDPNGRTTQVFINLRDNRMPLDTQNFVPFAKVIKGMDVADALYAQYGENSGGGIRAGHQDSLFTGGNAYLKRNFPLLDHIKRAQIIAN